MIVVDSHQHFWDADELDLPPLPPEAAILDRAYLPDDLLPEITRVGVDYTVLVQGFPQSLDTNRWYFRQANSTEFVAGVVAWMDLTAPSAACSVLDELQKEPKFAGIRHIVQEEPDVDWILRDDVLQSLRELARCGVPLDMPVKPQHLKNVLLALDKVPDLRMVIDHIAKPNIAGGGSPGWAEDLAAIAQRPQVYCKLSGLVTEADWQKWKPADLAPYVHHATDVFGWDRLMFGTDWPVCLLAGDYQRVWNVINELLSDIGQDNYAKVFGGNAIRFYQLNIVKGNPT